MNIKKIIGNVFNIDSLVEKLNLFLESKLTRAKDEIKAELAVLVSKLVVLGLLLYLGSFVALFALLAIALAINNWLHSNYWGFVVVFGLGLVKFIALLLMSQRPGFQQKVQLLIEKLMGVHTTEEKKGDDANQNLPESRKED